MTGVPTFADFPLDADETMADALEAALHDCSGAEPSLSVLFIRAEQAVPVLRELCRTLEASPDYAADTTFAAIWNWLKRKNEVLATARGETPNDGSIPSDD